MIEAWYKKEKSHRTVFALLWPWFLHAVIFCWFLYLFYLLMREEGDWRQGWWASGPKLEEKLQLGNVRTPKMWEPFFSSSALGTTSAKKDMLSNLALPRFTHVQNGEWNINFLGVCEALIQTGEKTHHRVKKRCWTPRYYLWRQEGYFSHSLFYLFVHYMVNSLESWTLFDLQWSHKKLWARVVGHDIENKTVPLNVLGLRLQLQMMHFKF